MKGTIKIMAYDYPEFIKGREDKFIKDIVIFIKDDILNFYHDITIKDIHYDEIEVEVPDTETDNNSTIITAIQDDIHDSVNAAVKLVIADHCLFSNRYVEDCPPFGRTFDFYILAPKVRYYIQWEV